MRKGFAAVELLSVVVLIAGLVMGMALVQRRQSQSIQTEAATQCEVEGGKCYPSSYVCNGGTSSWLACSSGYQCYFGGSCTAPPTPTPVPSYTCLSNGNYCVTGTIACDPGDVRGSGGTCPSGQTCCQQVAPTATPIPGGGGGGGGTQPTATPIPGSTFCNLSIVGGNRSVKVGEYFNVQWYNSGNLTSLVSGGFNPGIVSLNPVGGVPGCTSLNATCQFGNLRFVSAGSSVLSFRATDLSGGTADCRLAISAVAPSPTPVCTPGGYFCRRLTMYSSDESCLCNNAGTGIVSCEVCPAYCGTNNRCLPTPTLTPTPKPICIPGSTKCFDDVAYTCAGRLGTCTSDGKNYSCSSCPSGYFCNFTTNNCTPNRTPTPTRTPTPAVYPTCSPQYVCINLQGYLDCRDAGRYSGSGVCQAGICCGGLLPTPTRTRTPTPKPTATKTPTPTKTVTSVIMQLFPIADSFVQKGYPTRNYGSSAALEVDGSPVKVIFMKFDLSSLTGKVIVGANLNFKVYNSSSSTQNVKNTSNSWTETGITYANMPALGSLITTLNGGTAGNWVFTDVTGAVKSKAGQIWSIAVDSAGTDGLDFYSKEASEKVFLSVSYHY